MEKGFLRIYTKNQETLQLIGEEDPPSLKNMAACLLQFLSLVSFDLDPFLKLYHLIYFAMICKMNVKHFT